MRKESINLKTEKIKNWLKDPYHLILTLIILFTIIFRLYWFFNTLNQPLWWDEANYMNIARTWLGHTYWQELYQEIDVIRPPLFSLVLTIILGIGLGELSVKFFVLLTSILSIPLIYSLGKLFFDKKTGLISAFMLSVFWSFSFYSHRILVDVPLVLLWLSTLYFFFEAYFKNKSSKFFILPGILLGLSFLMKFSSIALVGLLFIYLLATERSKFLNKRIITFFITSFIVLIPFFIWQFVSFGSPLAFYTTATSTSGQFRSFFQSLQDQTIFSVQVLSWVFIILFLIGLLYFVSYIFLSWDKVLEKKSLTNRLFFILSWLVLALLFFGKLNYGVYMDERYYFVFYPAIFLIAGRGLTFLAQQTKKYHKYFPLILIIGILVFGGYQDIQRTNMIIKSKQDSFIQLKLAGEYIKENSSPEDYFLIVEEPAEVSYYAERNFILINKDNSTQIHEKLDKYKPKFIILSFYYSLGNEFSIPAIEHILTNQDIFMPVQTYGPYVNEEQTLPIVIIFQVNPLYYKL